MKKQKNKIKNYKLLFVFLLIIIIVFITLYYFKYLNKNNNNLTYKNVLEQAIIDETQITEEKTERMLKLEELKKENSDIVAWLEISNTEIDFPVLQCNDNEYYLKHNYKKEYSVDGSIFLDKDYNWELPSSNLLIYGHNNKNGNMFQGLLKYKEESYYKEHSIIRFTTIDEDCEYEIMAVFLSRVYYKSEQNVFRYYYFINAENEEEYNNYVKESKEASLYDTGVTAKYGEQLLTLSTCEYSQEDGRFVIVAKKIVK
jgi:sortase B